jgi:DNA-binding transcriptional regulator GbsR (MarR family)
MLDASGTTKEITMPGGRLTQQERQQIALGLADGLAYAEIARRIDRPTSTITREVMRNGGPTSYRADLAHRATERRARQRRQTPPRGQQAPPQAHGRDAEAVREYEETFTTVLMQSGLPNKMMSRVLTALYTTDAGSLTASELVERLQVSPASISKAITYLEGQGLVRRERDERRREHYIVDNDVWYQAMVASAQSTAQVVEIAREGVAILGPGTPAATRLENIARFLDFVAESVTRAAEQAREVLYTKPEPAPDAAGSENLAAAGQRKRRSSPQITSSAMPPVGCHPIGCHDAGGSIRDASYVPVRDLMTPRVTGHGARRRLEAGILGAAPGGAWVPRAITGPRHPSWSDEL